MKENRKNMLILMVVLLLSVLVFLGIVRPPQEEADNSTSDPDKGRELSESVYNHSHILANDFKTDDNSWTEAIQEAFDEAGAKAAESQDYQLKTGEEITLYPTHTVKLLPGDYEIDETLYLPEGVDFDFSDVRLQAVSDQRHNFAAIDAQGKIKHNHFKLPIFRGFSRALIYSKAEGPTALLTLEGGGFEDSIVGIDDVSFAESADMIVSFRGFQAVGTDQVLRIHADQAELSDFKIEHSGYDGPAIVSQSRLFLNRGEITSAIEFPESNHYGLVEQWTYSEPGQIPHPLLESGVTDSNPAMALNRGLKLSDLKISGSIPLVIWEGETWQDLGQSNAVHNHLVFDRIQLENHQNHLVKINRDLPSMVHVDQVAGYDDSHEYLYFTDLSSDLTYQSDQQADREAIYEHHLEDMAWRYQLYFGEGNALTDTNLSNDSTLYRFASEPFRTSDNPSNFEVKEAEFEQAPAPESYAYVMDFKNENDRWDQAIQNAVEATADTGDSATVSLAPGIYEIGETIQLPSQVDIDFSGAIFLATEENLTAIQADFQDNAYRLPTFVGFETALKVNSQASDSRLRLSGGDFIDNGIGVDDGGYSPLRQEHLDLRAVRSLQTRQLLNVNGSHTELSDVYATNTVDNVAVLNANTSMDLSNFIFESREPTETFDNKAWIALYNEGVNMPEAEQKARGARIQHGQFGGDQGQMPPLRSYLNYHVSGAEVLENYVILDTLQIETGNDGIQPRAVMAFHNDLPAYVHLDHINGMTHANVGYIWLDTGATDHHRQVENQDKHVIYQGPGAKLTLPQHAIFSIDPSISHLRYESRPYLDRDQEERVYQEIPVANQIFVRTQNAYGQEGRYIQE